MDTNESSHFFSGVILGIVFGFVLMVFVLRLIYFPAPKIVGFQETGYFVKYQNVVYQLTPQTAAESGSGKTSTNTESLK